MNLITIPLSTTTTSSSQEDKVVIIVDDEKIAKRINKIQSGIYAITIHNKVPYDEIPFDDQDYDGDDDDSTTSETESYDFDDASTIATTASLDEIQNMSDGIFENLDMHLMELQAVTSFAYNRNTQYDSIDRIVKRQKEENRNIFWKWMDGISGYLQQQ